MGQPNWGGFRISLIKQHKIGENYWHLKYQLFTNWMLPFSKFHVGTPLLRTEIYLWKSSRNVKTIMGFSEGLLSRYQDPDNLFQESTSVHSSIKYLHHLVWWSSQTKFQCLPMSSDEAATVSLQAERAAGNIDQSDSSISGGDWLLLSLVETFLGNLGSF